MKKVFFPGFVLLFGLWVLLPACEKDDVSSPADIQTQRIDVRMPFNGSYIAQPQIVGALDDGRVIMDIAAEGESDLLGKSKLKARQFIDMSDPLNQTLTGRFEFISAAGDRLTGEFFGEGEMKAADLTTFYGAMYVDAAGGTGDFMCATGRLPFRGSASNEVGEFFIESGYIDFTDRNDCRDGY